jgi:hypothetical protein
LFDQTSAPLVLANMRLTHRKDDERPRGKFAHCAGINRWAAATMPFMAC